MKHARGDYDRIQDPDGLIPDDEPVFLVRGQDVAGPETLRAWCRIAAAAGAEMDILNLVEDHANRMEAWQRDVAQKVPDLP
jgi:hypothetical protein